MGLLGGGSNGTMSGGGVGSAEALGLGQSYSAMQQYGASGLSGLLNPGLLYFIFSRLLIKKYRHCQEIVY